MLRRRLEPGKPSEFWAGLAFGTGVLTLVPLVAPAAASVSALLSLIAIFLSSRYPEKYAGRTKILLALGLCLLGLSLFFVEGAFFWRWKIGQAYDQRVAVTRLRVSQVAQALDQYRQEKGAYPELSGIMSAKAELEPRFTPSLPALDGFDGAISVMSRAEGFRVMATPPPPPGSEITPEPVVAEGGFQPAPSPPPPPPPPQEEGQSPAVPSPTLPESTEPNPAPAGLAESQTQPTPPP